MAKSRKDLKVFRNEFQVPNHPLNVTPLVKKQMCEEAGSLYDSGIISPPTLVRFESSPHPYNLRHQPSRWSSTPLPTVSAPGSSSTPASLMKLSASSPELGEAEKSGGKEHVEIVDFNKRLEAAVDIPEYDSGFESLLTDQSTAETPEVDKVASVCLGAIPKRRSPRIQASSSRPVDGVSRLTRLKSGKLNLETRLTETSDTLLRPSESLASCSERFSKEGRDCVDFMRSLSEKGLGDILLKYLSPEDLCQVSQVSQVWRSLLLSSSHHDDRRLEYLAKMKIERENYGQRLQFINKRISPRRILREVVNIKNNSTSPTSVKRDRNASSSAVVSPSKIRHKLFVEQARTLTPGERLVHCPLCTSPSRVSLLPASSSSGANVQSGKAECSSPKCQFLFCPDCQGKEHPGQPCRVSRPQSSRSTRSGGVTSKKSKARLRRL